MTKKIKHQMDRRYLALMVVFNILLVIVAAVLFSNMGQIQELKGKMYEDLSKGCQSYLCLAKDEGELVINCSQNFSEYRMDANVSKFLENAP